MLQISLAKENGQAEIGGQVVVFTLENQKYGIEISCVKEIMNWANPTNLPGMSNEISGVIKLRDQVISVISLRRQFGLPEVENLAETKIIILEIDTVSFGIHVDQVDEVVNVPALAVEFPGGLTVKTRMVQGIAKLEDYLLILIDTRELFTADVIEQIIDQTID